MDLLYIWEWKLFWQGYMNKKCQTWVSPLLTYRYISIWNTENLKKQFRQKGRKKNIRKGSIHLQQWMWTGLRLQLPTSDLLTVWRCDVHCLLQEGEGYRLTGFLHASRMSRHPRLQTLALWNANTTSPPLMRIRLDTFCCDAYLKRAAGAINAGSIFFVGFCLWLCNRTYTVQRKTGWTMSEHCIVGLLIRRRQPEDIWPMMSGPTVCVQIHLLYFHLEKK